MDVNLSNDELHAWAHLLPRYLRGLKECFPGEVQQDNVTLLQEVLASQGNDGEPSLVKIENGAQVLRIMQLFLRLALRDLTAAVTAPAPSPSIPLSNAETGLGQQIQGHPIYSSVPFRDASSQIRLVELLPGRLDDPIAVNLFVVERGRGQYAALSYVWGVRNADVFITVLGQPLDVSANLAEALRCLRHKDKPRVIWIDAICINQSDDAEKSAQVAMMGDIYRNAAEVVIFLGSEKDDSDLVMRYLELEDETPADLPWHLRDPKDHERAKKHVLGRIQRCGVDPARFFSAIDAFIKRPWWTRVWTVQEFALARRDHVWCCGRRSVSSPSLRSELRCLVQYFEDEVGLGLGSREVMADPQIGAEGRFAALNKTSFVISLLLTPRTEQWEAMPLMMALTMFQYRQSTDPRDYIYALREMLSPIARHVFVPNYSLTAAELFAKASSYLLLSEDRTDRVYATFALLRAPGMPSWALDFANPLPPLAQGHHMSFGVLPVPYQPSRRPAVLDLTMRISGVVLDTLDAVITLDKAGSDTEKTGLLWRTQARLRHLQLVEALPEVAKPCIPETCLLPLDSGPPGREGTNPLTWPVTPMIPGYPSFGFVVMKNLVSSLVGPRFRPENLTCEKWKDAPRRSPSRALIFIKACQMMVQAIGDFETFYGGACFDHENLTAKILGVKFQEDGDGQSQEGTGTANHEPSEVKATTTTREGYTPQYARITNLLHEATTERELHNLQRYLLAMAGYARDIFHGTGDINTRLTDPHFLKLIPGLWEQHHRETLAAYRTITETCSCSQESGDREGHRRAMKLIIDGAEDSAREMQPDWEQVTTQFTAVRADSIRPASELFEAWNRDLSGIFTTRKGFAGYTFQRRPGLKKGDVLALLEGMPAPLVLEEVPGTQGGRYWMKALVHVHGIRKVDVERLVELGVCVRREFDIV